ncbi:spermatogenesis-associated protein 31A7-like [Erinaceus europaeus]|uniref:Spermatogenesis-associated protein 31A7-like n=1 Tax=Erinaceus europaeus TaxID=9365 RepID=A0ABM3Y2Y2_ERIEU|nr:spermatogenesis-associated protein 31A7-like [Erinaceus europaeus]
MSPEIARSPPTQQCRQLFWGHPKLHSESLVAAVRLLSGSPHEQPPQELHFNQLSGTLPKQEPVPRGAASALAEHQPEPSPATQPQLWAPAMNNILLPTHTLLQPQTRAPPTPRALPASPPPPPLKTLGGSGAPCHKTEPSALPADMPHRLLFSIDLRGHRPQLPGSREARTRRVPSQPSVSQGQSGQEAQKMGTRAPPLHSFEKALGQGVGQSVGQVVKGLQSRAASLRLQVPQATWKRTSGRLKRPWARGHQKQLPGQSLWALEGRKVEPTEEGQLPGNVPGSSSTTSMAVALRAQSVAGQQARSILSSKGLEPCTLTPLQCSVLTTHTCQVLEKHVTRLWVRHRWHLPLKLLKPLRCFRAPGPQLLALPPREGPVHPGTPCLASRSHSKASSTRCLAEAPPDQLGGRVNTRMSPQAPNKDSAFPASSAGQGDPQDTFTKESPWVLRQGSSVVPLTGQGTRPPAETAPCFVGRFWHRAKGPEALEDGLQPSSTPGMAPSKQKLYPAQSAQRGAGLELHSGPQSAWDEEDNDAVQVREVPGWEGHLEPTGRAGCRQRQQEFGQPLRRAQPKSRARHQISTARKRSWPASERSRQLPAGRSCALLLSQDHEPPESLPPRKTRQLEHMAPEQGREPEESPYTAQPVPTAPQNHHSQSHSPLGPEGCAQAEALTSAVGHYLEQQVALHRHSPKLTLPWCHQERRGPQQGPFCSHKLFCNDKQSKIPSGSHSRHQATLHGHS